MKSGIGLAIAIGLGVLAGALNWWVVHRQVAPEVFVKVSRNIDAGQVFDEKSLEEIAISGDLDAVKKAAIPFKERAVLFNRPAARDLHEGDLVLWRDAVPPAPTDLLADEGEEALPVSLEGISIVPRLLQVGDEVGFLVTKSQPAAGVAGRDRAEPKRPKPEMELTYVGPFRILSVGERLGRKGPDAKAKAVAGDERVITVAIKRGAGGKTLDDDSRQLVEAMDAMRSRNESGLRVVSMLLRPSRRAPAVTKTVVSGG